MEKKLKYITILIIVIVIGTLFIYEKNQSPILEVQAQQPQLIEKKVEEVNKVIKSQVQKEKRKELKIKEKRKKERIQKKKKAKAVTKVVSHSLYTGSQFMSMGVIYWGPYKWTWYSQNVLPGGGLVIPGRHLDEQGYICDGNNYLCLASSTIPKGTIIETPFGKLGKIYDAGCAPGTIDVYVGW